LYITAMWRKGGLERKTNKSIMMNTMIIMITKIITMIILMIKKRTWKLVYRRALMVRFCLFPVHNPSHALAYTHRARDFVGAA